MGARIPPGVPAEAVAAMQADLASVPPPAADQDLEALCTPPVAGALAPIRVGELGPFLRAVRPLLGALTEGDLAGALASHTEELIGAVCVGARVERAWLEAQTPEVLVDLAAQVIEANGDFFVRTLTPALAQATARVQQALVGAIASLG